MLEHPNRISFLILGLITAMAVIYAAVTWRKAPEMNRFTVEQLDEVPLDFARPDRIYYLPKKLDEISGLSYWDEDQILTVQDEDGKLFLFDLDEEKIIEEWSFGKDRDYEGVTHFDSSVYVLEMDGDIHHFNHRPGVTKYESKKFETILSYRNDTEGICYDPKTKQLLIVPKENQLNAEDQTNGRNGIYTLDPIEGTLQEQPIYFIDENRLGEIIYGEQERFLIKPSGIAVHPLSGNIYVVASMGGALVVLNRNSEILHIELLDRDIFPQPEGITFSPSGDLFISSEGKGIEPMIARFNHPNLTKLPSTSDNNE